MALRACGGGGHVLGLLVGARRVAHAERPGDEDEHEVAHPGGHRMIQHGYLEMPVMQAGTG